MQERSNEQEGTLVLKPYRFDLTKRYLSADDKTYHDHDYEDGVAVAGINF